MGGRLPILILLPSLSCRLWNKATACLSLTILPVARKCELVAGSVVIYETPCFFVYSYGIMRQCWQMTPGERPTFSELCLKVSKLIENIAGYLQMGYNPFTVGGGKAGEEGKEKKEGEKKEKHEEEERGEEQKDKGKLEMEEEKQEAKNEREEAG